MVGDHFKNTQGDLWITHVVASPLFCYTIKAMKTYSFKKALIKLVQFIITISPMLIGLLPSEVANMTVSGVLFLLLNFLKVKYA